MILQSLYEHYELLLKDPKSKVAKPGYSSAKVTFGLTLNSQGEVTGLLDLRTAEQRGKSSKLVAQSVMVPEQLKRAAGIAPNVLCDNGSYLLGVDTKGDPERAVKQFQAFKSLHETLLGHLSIPEIQPFLRFLETWRPEIANENPLIQKAVEELNAGANIVIRQPDGESFLHDHLEVKKAWEKYKNQNVSEVEGFCLVTGQKGPIARLHPSIKGVVGGQPTGGSIVSFNFTSVESYGKEKGQGLNAPVGEEATFGYTTALNYLLSKSEHRIRLGDATTVFWADRMGSGLEESIFAEFLDPSTEKAHDPMTQAWVKSVLNRISLQQEITLEDLPGGVDTNAKFYILGLSPNAARLSIRFWYVNHFGKVLEHLLQHYQDMAIEKAEWEPDNLSTWAILKDLAANGDSKNSSPVLAGSLSRSIFTGALYPENLFAQTISRIRADRTVNHIRASVLKACLLRKYQKEMKGVLTVSLNEQNPSIGYRLGRLFALLERSQQEAISTINTKGTIVDRAMGTAATMPRRIFPTLLNLNVHHLSKVRGMNEGKGIWLSKMITDIVDGLPGEEGKALPVRLDLKEQGEFFIGYYHQKKEFFKKATSKEEVEKVELGK